MQYQSHPNGQIDFYVSPDDLGAMMTQINSGDISFTGFNKVILNEKIKQMQDFCKNHSITVKLCRYGASISYSLITNKPVHPHTQQQFVQFFEKELIPFISNKIQSWYYDTRTQSWKL